MYDLALGFTTEIFRQIEFQIFFLIFSKDILCMGVRGFNNLPKFFEIDDFHEKNVQCMHGLIFISTEKSYEFLKTRPNQVRTLTVITSLIQVFKTLYRFLAILSN